MSISFPSSGDGLHRTSNLVASNSDYTAMCWVRLTAGTTSPAYQCVFTVTDAGYTGWAGIFTFDDSGTQKIRVEVNNSIAAGVVTAAFTPTLNTWYHITYLRTGNSHQFYVNGTFIGSATLSLSPLTITDLFAGYDGFSEPGLDMAFFKEWQDNIIPLDINNFEKLSGIQLCDLGDKVADTQLAINANDRSGNGNNWSTTGSPSFIGTPPTNISPETATNLAPLPNNFTQSARQDGLTYELHYKYTAGPSEVMLGFWAIATLATYLPKTWVYNTSAETSTNELVATDGPRRVQVQITNGVTYYFRVPPNAGNPVPPALLSIDALIAPNDAISFDDIFVNNDAPGFEAIVISSNIDFEVKKFIQGLASGESGDILDNGISILHDIPSNELRLYNSSFGLITTLTGYDLAADIGCIRTCKGTQRFWVVRNVSGTLKARYIEDDGTEGPEHTLTAISNVHSIAVNNDETILYFTPTGDTTLRRWDLVNDVIMSDLVADVPPYGTADILILEDNTILFSLIKTTAPSNVKVRRYNASGTLLNDYDYGTNIFVFPIGTPPRLAYANDSPNSFWIWLHLDSPRGLSRFINTKVSDGSTIRDVDQQEYSEGVYVSSSPTASPLADFGPAFSCLFFLIPGSGTGTIIVEKVVLPPGDPTEFDYTTTNLGGATFSLGDGDSQSFPGLTPGSGYGIDETVNPDYVTEVVVSNGSPVDDISVAAGEIVTVTYTNSKRGTITVGKMSSPSSGSLVFHFTSPQLGDFDLVTEGAQVFPDLAPGVYSIQELLQEDWFPTFLFSNLSESNAAILVAAGEDVTVSVLNSLGSPGSGIGVVVPGKRNDTIRDAANDLVNVRIPRPFFETGFIGDK